MSFNLLLFAFTTNGLGSGAFNQWNLMDKSSCWGVAKKECQIALPYIGWLWIFKYGQTTQTAFGFF